MKKLLFPFSVFWVLCLQAQIYEAENASYLGANTADNVTGASGSCIRLENEEEYVRVTANLSEAGTYKIYAAYASPFGNKNGYVSVNGAQKNLVFPETISCTELYIGDYNLLAGINTIEITPSWTWFYIDYVRIEVKMPTVSVPGFKVSGTKLLDSNDKEFIMRGVNMAWNWYQNTGMSQLEAIARAGANTVRFVLSDGGRWNKDDSSTVASLINKCEELKMIAVLEVHDYTGSDIQSDLIAAANYFVEIKDVLIGKENTVVINIANEWCGESNATNWTNGYKLAIPILRNAGLEHCLMVDAAGWGQYPKSIHDYGISVLNADPNKNVIFSIHMYEYAGASDVIKSNIDGVLNQNMALCIGEFGWYHSNGNVDEDLILSYCNEKNVGWLAWSWYGNGAGYEYLDLVSNPANENALNVPAYNGQSCNWGQKIVNTWKNEAVTCSIFTDGIFPTNNETTIAGNAVYPTKANDVIYVKSLDKCKIKITDLNGRMIYSTYTTDKTTPISCVDWRSGLYFVSFVKSNRIETYKMIR